jgi:hypothetical protein
MFTRFFLIIAKPPLKFCVYRNVRARILRAATEQKGIDLQACDASVHFVELEEDAGDNVHIGFRAWDYVFHKG